MTTLRQILDRKGHDVLTVDPDATVYDAIGKMAEHDVGAVVVLEDGTPMGIFTERHYARDVILKGRSSPATPVRDIMARSVICVRPDNTVDEAMAIMTEKRIRHLPVLDGDELVGIVSIGDLVKSKIDDQKFTIDQLIHYIHG